MTPPARHATTRPGPAALAPLAVAVVPALVLSVVLTLFVWPGLRLEPHGVDLAVVGPSGTATTYEQALARAEPGGFDVVSVPDLAGARQQVRDREVRGALLPGAAPRVLVASADGTAAAQALGALARSLPGLGPAVVVEDVVPLPAADPRGVAQSSGLLPVLVAGIALGAVLGLRRDGALSRLLAVAAGAALGGATGALVLHTWLGATAGSWWSTAGPVALAVAATALPVLGLATLLGTGGIGLAAVAFVLLGNPLSGATSSPALLPAGWSALGQALPPGATSSLLRGATGFGWAGTTGACAVLLGWVVVGAVLVALAPGRRGEVPVEADPGRPTGVPDLAAAAQVAR